MTNSEKADSVKAESVNPPAAKAQSVKREAGQAGAPRWELVAGPRRIKIVAWSLAAMIVVVFGLLGLVLGKEDTGVYFRVVDQVAVLLIGVLMALALLLFTRPRLRAGAEGVAVRNLFSEKVVEWDLVLDLSFPEGAAWARLELPDDEYAPVLAIQIYDKAHAVDAVRDFRVIQAKYTQSA